MKIKIVCIGKIKKKYLKEFVDDYFKRCTKYCNIDIVELKDEVLHDNNQASISKLLKKEEAKINKHLDYNAYTIAMAIEGKEYSSEEFSKTLNNELIEYGYVQFIIGGSYGISEELKKRCNMMMSFSKMTFPHMIMRGVVLEQIYRSFKIVNNETYHK
ncbi:MAG: 23S rRNA (pseudouridine(1915)-N(3))-methyltransferase RlmH [Bacilli bacterium]